MSVAYKENLLIAGMGRTGQSVADYFSRAGIIYSVCDDQADYPGCAGVLSGFQGYVIKSPGIAPRALPAVEMTEIINDVELFMRLCKKPVIMVTGTNGKSTVVTLLEHLLRTAGIRAMACGNNGIPVLQAMKSDVEFYILELSSYQLENMSSFGSMGSVLLNIGVDHVDRYRDMQEYLAVKQKIYTDSGVSVYPVNAGGKITYGEGIEGYLADSGTQKIIFRISDGCITRNGEHYCDISELSLVGSHNYLNICAALALVDALSLPTQDMVSALGSFIGLPHRMEIVCHDAQGRAWVNDSKSTNVHALRAALESQLKPVCLIAGGKGKGEDYQQVFSDFSHIIRKLVLFGEDARVMESQSHRIEDCVVVNTLAEAIEHVGNFNGDILFSPACASFDQYRDYMARGDDFRAHARRVTSC